MKVPGRGLWLVFGLSLTLCSCGPNDSNEDEIVDTSLNDVAPEKPSEISTDNSLDAAADELPRQTAKPEARHTPREDADDYFEDDSEAEQLEPTRASGPPLSGLFSADDYPADAQRNNEQGRVTVELLIGTDGRIGGCVVSGSSGSRSLDNATCRILRSRARFTPARDSSGRAVMDTMTTSIMWRLEG